MTRRTAFLLTLVIVLTQIIVQPVGAQPRVNNNCASDFGVRIPMLLIHGLNGFEAMWGDDKALTSMYAAVRMPNVIRLTFDYKNVNSEWVTNKDIGPKLAERIDCLAQNSLAGKGKGKVIVVAHSMGGLAARFALSQTVQGRKVADEVGLVITIGTPHDGSFWPNLCEELKKVKVEPPLCHGSAIPALRLGSKELAELPLFPVSVPVKALSGNVSVMTVILPSAFVPTPVPVPTFSDLAVAVKSADKYATTTYQGDGRRTFDCIAWVPVPGSSDAPCEHANLLKMPEIQAEVKASIEAYLNAARASLPKPTYLFTLGLRLDSNWDILKPAEDSSVSRKIVISKKTCNAGQFRLYCPGFVVADMTAADPMLPYNDGNKCNSDQVHDDLGWSAPKVLGKITVDGVEGEHFVQTNNCRFSDGTILSKEAGDVLHGWRFPGKVVVYDSEGTDSFSPKPVPGVEELLKTAVWR